MGGVCYCSIRLSQPSLAGVKAGAELDKNYFSLMRGDPPSTIRENSSKIFSILTLPLVEKGNDLSCEEREEKCTLKLKFALVNNGAYHRIHIGRSEHIYVPIQVSCHHLSPSPPPPPRKTF